MKFTCYAHLIRGLPPPVDSNAPGPSMPYYGSGTVYNKPNRPITKNYNLHED